MTGNKLLRTFLNEPYPPLVEKGEGIYLHIKDGKKYQVKGRWLRQDHSNRQLSIFRNLKDKEPKFDFLIAVFFDDTFNVTKAYKIPHRIVRKHAKPNSRQGGHILNSTAMKAVIGDDAVVPMTELLQAAQ